MLLAALEPGSTYAGRVSVRRRRLQTQPREDDGG